MGGGIIILSSKIMSLIAFGGKMKRNLFKRLIQIGCVLIELIGFTLLLTFISLKIEAVETTWAFIERMIFSYGLYQIIVFVILSTCNDVRKDSYLALCTNYKEIEIYIRYNDNKIKESIEKNIEYQLDAGTFNDKDIRNEYAIMKKLMYEKNSKEIERRIILTEHCMEESTLNWKYSFLLRWIKG